MKVMSYTEAKNRTLTVCRHSMEGNKQAVDWTWRNESASKKKQVRWKHKIQKGKGLSFHDSYACKNDCFHNPY